MRLFVTLFACFLANNAKCLSEVMRAKSRFFSSRSYDSFIDQSIHSFTIDLFIYVFIYLFIYLLVHFLFNHSFIYLHIHLFVCLFVCFCRSLLFVWFCLFVPLFVYVCALLGTRPGRADPGGWFGPGLGSSSEGCVSGQLGARVAGECKGPSVTG